jgi:beta propeller repeat protein
MRKIFLSLFFRLFAWLLFLSVTSPAMANDEIRITNDPARQGVPSISGDKVVWEDWRNPYNPEIYLYDFTNNIETRVTNNIWGQYGPIIAGQKIFWTDNRPENLGRDIYMYNIDTREEILLVNDPGDQYLFGASGNKIVWQDNRNTYSDIYAYDIEMRLETRITNGDSSHLINSFPSISGNNIVWQATSEDLNWNYEIFVYNLDTQIISKIVNDVFHSQQFPSISGNKIVWLDNRNGNLDIYMYDLITHIEKRITYATGNRSLPRIFNNKIAWLDSRNNKSNFGLDLYMYDITTEIETRITTDAAMADWFSLSENRIVWQDWRSGEMDIYAYEISLPPPNIPPVANIKPVQKVILGETAIINGSTSYDIDGTIVNYQWNFGDGLNGIGAVATHLYSTAGACQIDLIVTDNAGATATTSALVTVETPSQAINDLINLVKEMNLSRGITNALDEKLEDSIEALNAERIKDRIHAINKLQKFIESAQNQSGRKLTVEQSVQLVAAANRIIVAIQI